MRKIYFYQVDVKDNCAEVPDEATVIGFRESAYYVTHRAKGRGISMMRKTKRCAIVASPVPLILEAPDDEEEKEE